MNNDIESRLRDALRPTEPSQEFTQRLIARIGTGPAAAQRRARPAARQLWWLAGLAASLLVAVGVQQHLRAERELAQGLEARRQVLQALQMTSQKLDIAFEAVKHQSSALIDAESGA